MARRFNQQKGEQWCETCGGAHLDKECPLHEEVKSVEEVKYEEFGQSFPNRGNGAIYHKPSLEELMNMNLEESTRRRAEIEDWMKKLHERTYMNTRNQNASLKNLETQIEQLEKDYQAKYANEVPIHQLASARRFLPTTKHQETKPLLMKLTNSTEFISDDNVQGSKETEEGLSEVLPCQLSPKDFCLCW
ncbi:hypothetical protein Tco_1084603 [Tanacetum coccineum]